MWVFMSDKIEVKKSPCNNKGFFQNLAEAMTVKLKQ